MSHVPSGYNVFSQKVLGATSGGSLTLPAKAYITHIRVKANNANAITGGLKFGTSSGAADVVATLAVAGSALAFATDAIILKRWFSESATQQIFYDTVTLWNSANVDIEIIYYLPA